MSTGNEIHMLTPYQRDVISLSLSLHYTISLSCLIFRCLFLSLYLSFICLLCVWSLPLSLSLFLWCVLSIVAILSFVFSVYFI